MPFGVLSPGHQPGGGDTVLERKNSHHCLSAFCPPATRRADNGAVLGKVSVTIAFRRSVPRPLVGLRLTIQNSFESPLPFGVLSPGHSAVVVHIVQLHNGHHCLSAFCPPATVRGRGGRERSVVGHHCLSAFCPPATIVQNQDLIGSAEGHHCLSAFCPPATGLT